MSMMLMHTPDPVTLREVLPNLDHHNNAEAQATTTKLERLLGKRLKYIAMSGSPQQNNTVDCGVFVCIAMKHLLLKRLLRADASRKISMSMSDSQIQAKEGRKIMLKVIEEKRREGVRRSS
jgi:sentrin-specific protease 8